MELYYDSYYNQERKKCKTDIEAVRREDGQKSFILAMEFLYEKGGRAGVKKSGSSI